MARPLRIAGTLLAGLLSLLAAAVIALLVLAASPWGRDWILDQTQSLLRRHSDYRLEFRRASGNLLGTLVLDDLSLSAKGHVLLRVRRLSLTPNLPALLGGRAKVGLLRLEGPRLAWPLPLAVSPPGGKATLPALPLAVTVKRLEVVDGEVSFAEKGFPLKRLEKLELAGELELDDRGVGARLQALEARLLPRAEIPPLEFSARATWRGSRLDLTQARLSQGRNRLAFSGWLDWRRGLGFLLDLKGRIDRPRDLPRFWPSHPPAAPLALQGRLEGTPGQCRLTLDLSLEEEKAHISGELDLAQLAGRLEGRFQAVDLRRWGVLPAKVQVWGRAVLDTRGVPGLHGSFSRVGLALDRVRAQGLAQGSLHSQVAIAAGRIEAAVLRASGPWGSLKGRGWYQYTCGACPDTIQAHFQLLDCDLPAPLARLLPKLPPLRLGGEVRLTGKPQDLNFTVKLGPSVAGRRIAVKGLSAQGRLREGRWSVQWLELESDWLALEAKGRADQKGVEMSFSLSSSDPAALASRVGCYLPGLPPFAAQGLEASGELKGAWRAPALELSARLTALDCLGYQAQDLRLELNLSDLSRPLSGGRASLNARELAKDEFRWDRLEARLELGPPAHLNLTTSGRGWDVSLSASSPSLVAERLEATLTELAVTPPGRRPWRLLRPAHLSWEAGRLQVQKLTMTNRRQRVWLEGTLDPQGAVQARLGAKALRLGAWLSRPGVPRGTRLSGLMALSGNLQAPRLQIQGQLSRLKWPDLPAVELGFQGSYAGRLLKLQGTASYAGGRVLDLKARLGVHISLQPPVFAPLPHSLRASFRGSRLPLTLLDGLVPNLSELKGEAAMQITATGDLLSPSLQGKLHLTRGSFVIPGTGQKFRNIDIELSLKDQRLTVRRFTLPSQGRLRLSGYVDLPISDPGRIMLDLTASRFKLMMGPLGSTTVDASVSCRGGFSAPQITGIFKPRHAKLFFAALTPSELDEVVVLKPGQQPPPILAERGRSHIFNPGGFLGKSVLDLTVDLGKGVRVDLDRGWLMVSGNVLLRKPAQDKLRYYGQIRLDQGVITIQGRRFQLAAGLLDFAGKDHPDPDLSVEATYRSGQTLVFISVGGTPSDPSLQLSSQPPLSRTDILSTIIFGRTSSSLNQEQSQELQAQALALLGQQGIMEIKNILGPTFSPDVVTVHSEVQGNTALEAGKYLSPDLYLRYRRNVSGEEGHNLGLEYRVTPWLSLESQVGTTRDTGVDVIINFDF